MDSLIAAAWDLLVLACCGWFGWWLRGKARPVYHIKCDTSNFYGPMTMHRDAPTGDGGGSGDDE